MFHHVSLTFNVGEPRRSSRVEVICTPYELSRDHQEIADVEAWLKHGIPLSPVHSSWN